MSATHGEPPPALSTPNLVDPFGREITYVRLAVTRQCNLRCRYCRPGNTEAVGLGDSLSTEELSRTVTVLASLGIWKVRVTGGEPLVRPDIIELIDRFRNTPGLREVHLTTNGTRLRRLLSELISVGISGLNVSLDSLKPTRYREITGSPLFHEVWTGIEEAVGAGLPVKLNVVVQAGLNDDEIQDFCELSRDLPLMVRFIEVMPFNGGRRRDHRYLSWRDMLRAIQEAYPNVQFSSESAGTTQVRLRLPGARGTIGLIPGYSRDFCSRCNRLRVTADGLLKLCLYDSGGLDLKALFRAGLSDSEIAERVRRAVLRKPRNGHLAERAARHRSNQPMILIGG